MEPDQGELEHDRELFASLVDHHYIASSPSRVADTIEKALGRKEVGKDMRYDIVCGMIIGGGKEYFAECSSRTLLVEILVDWCIAACADLILMDPCLSPLLRVSSLFYDRPQQHLLIHSGRHKLLSTLSISKELRDRYFLEPKIVSVAVSHYQMS
jgi:hypothetical protein